MGACSSGGSSKYSDEVRAQGRTLRSVMVSARQELIATRGRIDASTKLEQHNGAELSRAVSLNSHDGADDETYTRMRKIALAVATNRRLREFNEARSGFLCLVVDELNKFCSWLHGSKVPVGLESCTLLNDALQDLLNLGAQVNLVARWCRILLSVGCCSDSTLAMLGPTDGTSAAASTPVGSTISIAGSSSAHLPVVNPSADEIASVITQYTWRASLRYPE